MTPDVVDLSVTDDTLYVEPSDGRTISVPLAWYPRLVHATQDERNSWELIGNGHGIRWPDLDEDLSAEGFIAGRQSGESQRSFKRWLEARLAGRSVMLYDLGREESTDDGGRSWWGTSPRRTGPPPTPLDSGPGSGSGAGSSLE